jgi:hypothetical protein
MLVAKGEGKRAMGNCLMGMEFQSCKMKRVLEIGCTTLQMYLTLVNCPLKDT